MLLWITIILTAASLAQSYQIDEINIRLDAAEHSTDIDSAYSTLLEIHQSLMLAADQVNQSDADITDDDHIENTKERLRIQLLTARTCQSIGKILIEKNKLHPDDQTILLAGEYLEKSHKLFTDISKTAKQQITNHVAALGIEKAKQSTDVLEMMEINIAADLWLIWNDYHKARIMKESKDRRAILETAQKRFKELMGDSFSFDAGTMNAYLGLCLCLYEEGEFSKLTRVLDSDIITPLNTDLDYFRDITVLRVRTYSHLKSFLKTHEYIEQYFDIRPVDMPMDSIDLDLAIEDVKSLAHLATKNQNNQYYVFYRTKLNAQAHKVLSFGGKWAQQVRYTLNSYDYELPAMQLFQALDVFNQKDYELAFQTCMETINLATDKSDMIYSELLFLKTACLYKLGRYQDIFESKEELLTIKQASEHFDKTVKLILESTIQYLQSDSSMSEDALKFMEQISPMIADTSSLDLETYIIKIYIASKRYRRAVERIEEIFRNRHGSHIEPIRYSDLTLDTDLYHDAQLLFLLAYANYKLAESDFKAIDARGYLDKTANTLDSIKDIAVASESQEKSEYDLANKTRQLYPAVIRGYALLQEPQCDIARKMLSESSFLDSEQMDSIELFISIREDDFNAISSTVNEIISQQHRTSFTIDTLVMVCSLFETKNDVSFPESSEKLSIKAKQTNELLISIYEYIIAMDVLKSDEKNILTFKLAKAYMQNENHDKARSILQSISDTPIAYSPLFQKMLGELLFEIDDYAGSAKCWYKLARLAQKRTPDWLTANYNLIRCRALNNETQQAIMLRKYFLAKYSQWLDETWKRKFNELIPKAN